MTAKLTDQVLSWLGLHEPDCYVVGGYVRDRLLGQPARADLDITTPTGAIGLARRLADELNGDFYALDAERGAGRVIVHAADGERLVVDVTEFRGPDLAADLRNRDFTVNAMAVSVGSLERVIDLHGGREDLAAGLIRAVADHSIQDDPLRALRAVRLAAQLGFVVDGGTIPLICRDGIGLKDASGERVRDELASLLILRNGARGLRELDNYGLLTDLFPSLESLRGLEQPKPHEWPVLEHSFRSVETLEALLSQLAHESEFTDPEAGPFSAFAGRILAHVGMIESDLRPRLVTLKLATLLHDLGKAKTHSLEESGRVRFFGHEAEGATLVTERLTDLRFSKREVRLGAVIVRNHMRPLALAQEECVTARAVYRFYRDTGPAGVETLLLGLADHQATRHIAADEEAWVRLLSLTARMLGDYWQRRTQRVSPPALIRGGDLLREFNLQPGPLIGELLEAVLEAQASGEVQTVDEALALVRDKLGSL